MSRKESYKWGGGEFCVHDSFVDTWYFVLRSNLLLTRINYVPLTFFVYKWETQSGQLRYYIDTNVWPVKSELAILPRQSK
jgi:hypothetical protein